MKDLIIAGSKIYAQCPTCGSLVRINKPLFGSLHICLSDEERAMIEAQRAVIRQNRQATGLHWFLGAYAGAGHATPETDRI